MAAQARTQKKKNQTKTPEKKSQPETGIRARRFDVDYTEVAGEPPLEKNWADGNTFLTHWLNAYTMTIPGGEAMIVQTIEEFMDQIDDPALKKTAQGLIGQELSHSRGHKQFIEVLERQGFSTRFYSGITNFLSYRILEPTSTPLQRLAFIVGVERINELFAEITLESGKLRSAPPKIRALYEWHLAEEIEHKSVVFDVYHKISGSRFWLGYGIIMSYLVNMGYLALACASFLWQDRALFRWKTWAQAWRYFFREERFLPRMTSGCWAALKKGFHPSATDNRELAEHVLSRRVITAV